MFGFLEKLGLMSPSNPGYSSAAPLYNFKSRRYVNPGWVWVKRGKDTPAKRDRFRKWYKARNKYAGNPKFITAKQLEAMKLKPEFNTAYIKHNQSMFKYFDVETGKPL